MAQRMGGRRQRGFSLLGFVFLGVVLAALGVVLAQVVPTLVEYQAVVKAVKKSAGAASVAEARAIFDRATQVDAISAISARDLEIIKDGEKLIVKFAYQREIHLVGPAYLTLKYAGQAS
ncbi:MAG: hypothetical protein OHK0048_17050 [Rhodoferax sp.]